MTADQMRRHISMAYPGDRWKDKVERMSDEQVIAIYYSMLSRKGTVGAEVFDRKTNIKKSLVGTPEHGNYIYEPTYTYDGEQLSFNDLVL